MGASNNQENNSNTIMMSLMGMTINNTLNINKRSIEQISRISRIVCCPMKENSDNDGKQSLATYSKSKIRKLSPTSITSHNKHDHDHDHDRCFMTVLPRRRQPSPSGPDSSSTSTSSSTSMNEKIPIILNPCKYMMKSFQNKNIKTTRIDSFSIEQALYFEQYQESEIKTDILNALRTSNVDQLRSSFLLCQEDLTECNQFGENLLHLACRMGSCCSIDVILFLFHIAKVPLNVRDRFGRTPFHHACMSSHPNFDNLEFVIRHTPRMVLLFEDDNGKIPFELIPLRCYERWTQFLKSEKKEILFF